MKKKTVVVVVRCATKNISTHISPNLRDDAASEGSCSLIPPHKATRHPTDRKCETETAEHERQTVSRTIVDGVF